MKVLVKVYANYNLGDDLFLHLLFKRYPTVTFRLIAPDSYEFFLKHYHNVERVSEPHLNLPWLMIVRLFRLFYCYRLSGCVLRRKWIKLFQDESLTSDAYLYIGGSIFMQHEPRLLLQDSLNKLINEYFDKSYIIGANFGPYVRQSYLVYYRDEVFPRYTDVCFRDTYSSHLFKELKNVHVASDIVFNLPPLNVEKNYKSVGISVMDFTNRPGIQNINSLFVEKIVDAIESLSKEGYSFTLYSFCEREGDEIAIRNIQNKLSDSKLVKTCYYRGNIGAFLSDYATVETMVTTRFHSMILSLVFKQQLLPLIYSDKVMNVLADLNYKDNLYHINDIGLYNVTEAIRMARIVNYDNQYYQNAAVAQFEKLDQLLF